MRAEELNRISLAIDTKINNWFIKNELTDVKIKDQIKYILYRIIEVGHGGFLKFTVVMDVNPIVITFFEEEGYDVDIFENKSIFGKDQQITVCRLFIADWRY